MNALVTGASQGIGKAIAERLRTGGYQVAGCASRPEALKKMPVDLPLLCDVSKPDQVAAMIEKTVKSLGPLSVVVNNAGTIAKVTPPNDLELSVWQEIIDVNLNGTYYVCQAVLPHLVEGARILNLSSVLGMRGSPDAIAYTAAKHGVIGLTRALALRLAERRITVNALCPGWTRTPMAEARLKQIGVKDLEKRSPLGRFVEPEEVAALAAFLCSAEAAAITGQAFVIDGGALASI